MGTGRTDGFRKDAVRIALTGGLTQTALAETAGVNRETVAGIEARRKQG